MSDMQEQVEEQVSETPVEAVEEETTEEQPEEAVEQDEGQEPKKADWVELSPEAQRKFNDMYKQVKMSDARNQLKDQMLEKAMSRIEELEKRFSETDSAEAERIFEQRIQQAYENGDTAEAARINKEMVKFMVDQQTQKSKPKEEVKQPQSLDDIKDPETRYVANLAMELDDTGAPVRPWLSENHPRHQEAIRQAQLISDELRLTGESEDIPKIMKKLDDRMNKKVIPPTRRPDPMQGGNLTTGKNGLNIKPKLSEAEKTIARKLGMSEQDYLDGKITYGAKK